LTRGNGSGSLRRVKEPTQPGTLAGRVQVRRILDEAARANGRSVSKQWAWNIEREPDFPAPLDKLDDGHGRKVPIYARHQIEGYAKRRSAARA
jgi:hypothetical protein